MKEVCFALIQSLTRMDRTRGRRISGRNQLRLNEYHGDRDRHRRSRRSRGDGDVPVDH